jgi:hypothetical protein
VTSDCFIVTLYLARPTDWQVSLVRVLRGLGVSIRLGITPYRGE